MANIQASADQMLTTHPRAVDQHFAVKAESYNSVFSPESGMLRLFKHGDLDSPYWHGDFIDPRGIVTVQRELSYLRIDYVAGGKCHVRTWGMYFGDRTVARLCRAFITEIEAEISRLNPLPAITRLNGGES